MDTSDNEDSDSSDTDGFDPNIFMAGAMHAWPCKDVATDHLSKIWQIDLQTGWHTLDITTQHQNTPTCTQPVMELFNE